MLECWKPVQDVTILTSGTVFIEYTKSVKANPSTDSTDAR